jgi:hypothetical protein
MGSGKRRAPGLVAAARGGVRFDAMSSAKRLGVAFGSLALAALPGCGGHTLPEYRGEAPAPIELTFGPYEVAPGEELDFCEYFEIDSDQTSYVTRLAQENLGKAHHAFLYSTSLDKPPGRGECPNVVEKLTLSKALYAATALQGPSEMPTGVAMELEPRQKMFLNIHLLNTGSEPVTDTVTLKLDRGDPLVEWTPVGFLELTTTQIDIPAQGTATAGNTCKFDRDISVLELTSHSHSRTESVTANLWDGVDEAKVGEEIYRNTSWVEPAVLRFIDDVVVKKGTGIAFECSYVNPDPFEVKFGDKAEDEMCYVLGYYYPGPDTIVCAL